MQKINTSRSFLALSALGLALLPLGGGAQAKPKDKGGPPDYAPAYGRRNRDGDLNRDDDFKRNRGRNRDRNGDRVSYDDYGRIVTLEGIVTSVDNFDNNGTRNFRVQAGGRSFAVSSDSNVRVRQGQRVVLRGSFEDGNRFSARQVTIAGRPNDDRNNPYENDDWPTNDRRVDFPGVVTRVFGSGELEVRAENGRIYRVEPRDGSGEFQVGNRVRVAGVARNNRVENARLTFQNGGVAGGIFGNGGVFGNGNIFGGSSESGKGVDFSARIVRINSDRRTAVVRGDNGREYTIRSVELKNYRGGERVRVIGVVRFNVVEASDIDRL